MTKPAPSGQSNSESLDTLRLDIWLFRTRFLKTRVLAARIIRNGRVRITRQGECNRILKPHAKVRAGDVLTFMREKELINIEVLSHPLRRGPAAKARLHYEPHQT